MDVDGRAARWARSTSRSATPARRSPGSPTQGTSARRRRAAGPAGTSPTRAAACSSTGTARIYGFGTGDDGVGRALAGRALLRPRGPAGQAPPAAHPARVRRLRLPRPRRRRLARTSTGRPAANAVLARARPAARRGGVPRRGRRPRRRRRPARAGPGTSTPSPRPTRRSSTAFEAPGAADRRGRASPRSSSSSTRGGGSRSSTRRSRRALLPAGGPGAAPSGCSTTATTPGRPGARRWYRGAVGTQARSRDRHDNSLTSASTTCRMMCRPSRGRSVATAEITFDTDPSAYRHWELTIDAPVATLTMRVTPDAGLRDDYELKLNSYDLGVDIELLRRRRSGCASSTPRSSAVVVTGGLDKVFCAGANIQMLAGSTHAHKVDFCKFTNETRNAHRGRHRPLRPDVDRRRQRHGGRRRLRAGAGLRRDRPRRRPVLGRLAARGAAARRAARHRRPHPASSTSATSAATSPTSSPPGPRASRASRPLDWGLVDAIAPRSRFDEIVARAGRCRGPPTSPRPDRRHGRRAHPAARRGRRRRRCATSTSTVAIDRDLGAAHITVHGPTGRAGHRRPADRARRRRAGSLAAARQLDDAVLRLRFNEPEVGTWVLRTAGDAGAVLAAEDLLRRPRRPLARQRGPRCSGPARSSASTCPPARSSRSSSPGSCFAGRARRAGARRRPLVHARRPRPATATRRRRRSTSPTPTTAGSRWPTA